MTIGPITPAAAALRAQILGAAESELISALAATQEAKPTAPLAQAPAPATNPAAKAVEIAKAEAAGRQASLAPLFADLSSTQSAAGLANPVKAAIAQVLALQVPLDSLADPAAVEQAVAQSGLFLEARLAAEDAGPQTPPRDLKAALLTLRQMLSAEPAPAAAPAPETAAPQRVPPPARGAGLTAQAPEPRALPPSTPLPAIVQHLAAQVDRAVARQLLHQLASRPDGASTAWVFELPVATPQGTGVAQFEISRDGSEPGAPDPSPAWQVRFAIDIDPLGPVQVHLRTEGERVAVTIWAEREDGLERLREEGAELARDLPADVTFRLGAPKTPTPPRGGFVDRTS